MLFVVGVVLIGLWYVLFVIVCRFFWFFVCWDVGGYCCVCGWGLFVDCWWVGFWCDWYVGVGLYLGVVDCDDLLFIG